MRCTRRGSAALLTASLLTTWAGVAPGDEAAAVCSMKVISNKVEDVTTLEAWKRAFIKPGMTDREKGLAIWETVVKFRHQESPPMGLCFNNGNVHDPIKTFNVYGYGMCCCAASNIECLGRHIGLKARGRILNGHSVPELWWDDDWHLLDSSLVTWFEDAGGKIASVDEIVESIQSWHAKNPGYKNKKKLRDFARDFGWRKGPAVLATSKYYEKNGWLPAYTHAWWSTIEEYDKKRGVYEYGYSQGYSALFRLREGEVLTRNWSHRGLHVNMDGTGGKPGCLKPIQMAYARRFGNLAPGRVGNGTLLYRVPLDGQWRRGASALANIAPARGITAEAKDRPAEAVIRMHCPYMFLGGKVRLAGAAPEGSSLRMLLSTNNALDFTEVWKPDEAGAFDEEIDLGRRLLRRFDYYVKLVLEGGARIEKLEFENDIQHAQRTLPILDSGENTITISGGDPVDTISVEPAPLWAKSPKIEVMGDFRPVLENVKTGKSGIWCAKYGVPATATFPVETPGDIRAVRFGGHLRARGTKDGHEFLVSFDDGKTWIEAGRAWGPFKGTCHYVEFKDVPKGKRKVLVRYKMHQGNNTTGVFGLRIDVDYWDTPDGKPVDGALVRPVKVTYVWEENGAPKKDVHITKGLPETYKINCATKPQMKSVIVELAD